MSSSGPSNDRREDVAASSWEEVAALLYKALNGVYLTEINGRLCALPEPPDPWFDPEGEAKPTGCQPCQDLWERIKVALRVYEDADKRRYVDAGR